VADQQREHQGVRLRGARMSWSAQTAAGWSTRSSSTQVSVAPLEPAAVDGAVVVNAMT
jgi:hypothetical protein